MSRPATSTWLRAYSHSYLHAVAIYTVVMIPVAVVVFLVARALGGSAAGAWGRIMVAMAMPLGPVALARMALLSSIAGVCIMLVYELGRAAVGLALGARQVRLETIPVVFSFGPGIPRLQLTREWPGFMQAQVGPIPEPTVSAWRWIALGGPLATLLVATAATLGLGWLEQHAMNWAHLAWFVSLVGLFIGVADLVSVRQGHWMSGGAQFIDSLGDGAPVAEARLTLQGLNVVAASPGDWPQDAVELLARDPRATAMDRACLVVPWLLDAGRLAEAEAQIEALCARREMLAMSTARKLRGLQAWFAVRSGVAEAARPAGAKRAGSTLQALLDLELAAGGPDLQGARARAQAHLAGRGRPDTSLDVAIRELLARRLAEGEDADAQDQSIS